MKAPDTKETPTVQVFARAAQRDAYSDNHQWFVVSVNRRGEYRFVQTKKSVAEAVRAIERHTDHDRTHTPGGSPPLTYWLYHRRNIELVWGG